LPGIAARPVFDVIVAATLALRWRSSPVAPGGSWLATGGDDRTVRNWDAATGKARALMDIENMIFAYARGLAA
jgi:WD40 repeat protein